MRKYALIIGIAMFASGMAQGFSHSDVHLNWGVGFEQFANDRAVGLSQILDIEFAVQPRSFLFVHSETQRINWLGNNGASAPFSDGDIIYTGLGLRYQLLRRWTASVSAGKAKIDAGSLIPDQPQTRPVEQTVSFIDLGSSFFLFRKTRPTYDFSIRCMVRYRFMESVEGISVNRDVDSFGDIPPPWQTSENFSGGQYALFFGFKF